MSKDREKIAKRRQRRRRRRLKTSVKVFIAIFVFAVAGGGFAAYYYNVMKNAPDPYGKLEDLQGGGEDSNNYNLTDDVMPDAKYWIINAGKGEAIYIKSGDTDILIDTGADEKGSAVIKAIEKEITGELEYLLITSPSYRRIGGLKAVCDRLKPEKIITCPLNVEEKKQVQNAANDISVIEGKDSVISISKDSTLTIFRPEVSSSDPLDQSLMTLFKYGNTSFFAESDAGEEEEARVIGSIEKCQAIVLSRAGSDAVNQHIEEASPYELIVSTDKENPPSDALVSSLTTPIYATYKSGTIMYTTNGKEVTSNIDRIARLDADL